MDLLSQRNNVTTNGGGTAVGMNANSPIPAATTPPIVREQAAQDGRLMMSLPESAPAKQESVVKRARDAEPVDAGPPSKRMRTTLTSGAVQVAASALPPENGLCAMPDDVLRLIVAALVTAAPMTDVRDLERLRACSRDLQKRVAAPLPAVVQELKYQASEKRIRIALSNMLLDGRQVQEEVRALCDRHGDVRVSLRNRAGLLPTSPHARQRNQSALAGIAESTEMRSLLLI